MSIIDTFERILHPIKRRISNIFIKAILDNIDYSSEFSIVQLILQKDEIQDRVEFIEPYGFISNPPKNSSVLVGCLNGDRNQMLAICIANPQGKPETLNDDATGLYNTQGTTIILDGKNVSITCPSGGQLNVNNGNLTVDV